jgi:hypothetical protein
MIPIPVLPTIVRPVIPRINTRGFVPMLPEIQPVLFGDREFIRPINRLQTDDIKETETQARHRLRIQQLDPVNDRREITRLRRLITMSERQQIRKTNERRNNIFSSIYSQGLDGLQLVSIDQLYELRLLLLPYEGTNIVMRIYLQNGENDDYPIFPYQNNRFGSDIMFPLCTGSPFDELRPDLRGGVNVKILRESDVPMNRNFAQVFRKNPTTTCFFDALVLPKRFDTAIEKLKKKFPNGVSEDNIIEISNKLNVKVNIKPLCPIPWLIKQYEPQPQFTKSGEPRQLLREQFMLNSTPHHLVPTICQKEIIEVDEKEFYEIFESVKNEPIMICQNFSLMCSKGIFYMKRKSSPSFDEQIKFHLSTHSDGIYEESDMIGYQSLEFCSTPRYFQQYFDSCYEYDMENAYLQFPFFHGGYLVKSQEGYFTSLQIQELIKIHDPSFLTLYFEVIVSKMSELHQKMGLPERFVCGQWFLPILEDCEYHIEKWELRKSFQLDISDYKSHCREYFGAEYNTKFKPHYVKEFGRMARRNTLKIFDIHGVDNEEFFGYAQSQIPIDNSKDYRFTKTECYYGSFEDQDEYKNKREWHKMIDLKPKFTYQFRMKEKRTKNCPQVLNDRSLYCYFAIYQQVNSIPLSDLLGITLDSFIIKTKIDAPIGFILKKIHDTFEKESPQINYQGIELNKRVSNPTEINLKQVFRINYVLGAGGWGKSTDLKNKFPHYLMFGCPTKELRNDMNNKDQRKVYCRMPSKTEKINPMKHYSYSLTHHRIGGFNCPSVEFEGIFGIDEITFLSQEQIDQMLKLHPESIFYFLGDVSEDGIPYQCYSGEQNKDPIPYQIINPQYAKKDYRSKDDRTKELKMKMRGLMGPFFKQSHNQYHRINELRSLVMRYIPSIKRKDINPLHRILTGTRGLSDFYERRKLKSMNAHRVQGGTITEKFYVDLTHCSLQTLYTMISRCELLEHITLIEYENYRGNEDDVIEEDLKQLRTYSVIIFEEEIKEKFTKLFF